MMYRYECNNGGELENRSNPLSLRVKCCVLGKREMLDKAPFGLM